MERPLGHYGRSFTLEAIKLTHTWVPSLHRRRQRRREPRPAAGGGSARRVWMVCRPSPARPPVRQARSPPTAPPPLPSPPPHACHAHGPLRGPARPRPTRRPLRRRWWTFLPPWAPTTRPSVCRPGPRRRPSRASGRELSVLPTPPSSRPCLLMPCYPLRTLGPGQGRGAVGRTRGGSGGGG